MCNIKCHIKPINLKVPNRKNMVIKFTCIILLSSREMVKKSAEIIKDMSAM